MYRYNMNQIEDILRKHVEILNMSSEQKQIRKMEILRELASNISTLEGIKKGEVVDIIVRGFAKENVKISHDYVYAVLGPEYKR